jgi:hypothetical protein
MNGRIYESGGGNMAKGKDFGERVRGRLKALGYVKNGRLDVNGFSVEKGYIPSYVYRWAKGEVPRGQALIRFARDLKVSPEELLGPPPPPPKRTPHPITGGADVPGTPPPPNYFDEVRRITEAVPDAGRRPRLISLVRATEAEGRGTTE